MKILFLIIMLIIGVIVGALLGTHAHNQINLKPMDMFYAQYRDNISKFYVEEVNDKGVFISFRPGLVDSPIFMTFSELKSDETYKYIGHYKAARDSSPLISLKPMDMFRMVYGGGNMPVFIVKEVTEDGLICTTTKWDYDANVFVYFDHAPTGYKYMGKYNKLSIPSQKPNNRFYKLPK